MDLIAITSKIRQNVKRMLPINYSVEAAMQSAYLKLLDTVDKNQQPALQVCTKESIYNALLDMVVQGLNPMKNQCYFVVYKHKLQMIRSYMGSIKVAKDVDKIISEIRAEVIHEGDKVTFEIIKGEKFIREHIQDIDSLEKPIKAAYAIALDENGEAIYTQIMSMKEIRESWKNSKTNIDKPDSNHNRFPGEMSKRTVINRLCKSIINTSDDRELLKYNETFEDGVIIDIETPKLPDFSDQKKTEPINMATREQAKIIHEMSIKLNRDDTMMFTDISGFINRDTSKLSDMTANEADEYIEALKGLNNGNNEMPTWAE